MPDVHPTAIIDDSATLADDVVVGPFCVIGPAVRVGAGTVLADHVTLARDTTLGRDCRVYPYSVLGADPQDRKYHGEHTTCAIGDRNQIREHVTIHRGTENGGGETIVGDDNLIMVGSHVAHDCVVGNHVTIANQVMLAGHVRVEDGASIGGGTGVHHFATIGRYSMVGGMTRAAKDVPPFMLVEGAPAEVRGHNHVAMKRAGFDDRAIEAIKDAYKRLYRPDEGANFARTIEQLREEFDDVEAIAILCAALERAGDGVHGRAAEAERQDDKYAGQR